jgi:hypothetical protein
MVLSSVTAWVRKRRWPLQASWPEMAAAIALMIVIVCAACLSARLTAWQWLILATVAFLAVATLHSRGRVVLFGPVFGYDLVRIARREQYLWIRGAYAGLLLALFFFVYARWSFDKSVNLKAVLSGTALDRNALPDFVESFF